MADLNFYLNNNEKIELLKQLYDVGCKIVPDLAYEYSECIILNNLEECLRFIDLNDTNLLFVLHSKFSILPFILDPIKKDNKTIYSIRQHYGGPSLSLFFTGIYEKDNTTFLGHGFLSYYSYYYDPINNDKIPIQKDLIKIFKIINKWVTKNSVPYKLHSRTYRLGKDAIKQAFVKKYNLRDINNASINELYKSLRLPQS